MRSGDGQDVNKLGRESRKASKRLGEVSIVEQRPDLSANVCAHVVRRGGDITHNLRTAIDDAARDQLADSSAAARSMTGCPA